MTFQVPRNKSRKDRATRGGNGSRYRKKSGVYAIPVGFAPKMSGGTRDSVLRAAGIVLERVRLNAAKFSKRIPAATNIESRAEQEAMIVTDGNEAPNGAPFEFGERHPLFGDRELWYKQPRRSYMSNAARHAPTVAKAAEEYGKVETDLLADEYGYNE